MSPPSKIVCVGRNYAAHAAEMGAPRPEEPLLFLKPPSALHLGGGALRLPGFSEEVQHEVEMVLRLGRELSAATPDEAARAVDAVTVGLDLTARDLQARAKAAGHPWAVAKGFDGAAPIGDFRPIGGLSEVADLELGLRVGGELRQRGRTSDLLFPLPELIAFVSTRFTLRAGDLLFTGTPEGVGPLRPGDRVEAWLGEVARLELRIAAPSGDRRV